LAENQSRQNNQQPGESVPGPFFRRGDWLVVHQLFQQAIRLLRAKASGGLGLKKLECWNIGMPNGTMQHPIIPIFQYFVLETRISTSRRRTSPGTIVWHNSCGFLTDRSIERRFQYAGIVYEISANAEPAGQHLLVDAGDHWAASAFGRQRRGRGKV
jgi:hypothetical protein